MTQQSQRDNFEHRTQSLKVENGQSLHAYQNLLSLRVHWSYPDRGRQGGILDRDETKQSHEV